MRQWLHDCISCDPVRRDGIIIDLECGRKTLEIKSCTHVPGESRHYYDKDGICVCYTKAHYIDNETERVIKEG